MTTITSAGAGSGIDLESVISASLEAKKTQQTIVEVLEN